MLWWLGRMRRLLCRELGGIDLAHGAHHVLLMHHALMLLHVHHCMPVHHHVHRVQLVHLLLTHHVYCSVRTIVAKRQKTHPSCRPFRRGVNWALYNQSSCHCCTSPSTTSSSSRQCGVYSSLCKCFARQATTWPSGR